MYIVIANCTNTLLSRSEIILVEPHQMRNGVGFTGGIRRSMNTVHYCYMYTV